MPNVIDRPSIIERMSTSRKCLVDCCATQTPITLISPHTGATSEGFFQRIDGASLTVRLTDGQPLDFADKTCCATYVRDGRRWTFLSFVSEVNEGAQPELVLEVSAQILAEKRARAIRFAIPKDAKFNVNLRVDDREFKGHVININAQGALVEFEELIDVKLETPVQLELRKGVGSVVVPACPVRRESARLGFAFEGETGEEWKASLRALLEKNLGFKC